MTIRTPIKTTPLLPVHQTRFPSISNAVTSSPTTSPGTSIECDNSATSNQVRGMGRMSGLWKYALMTAAVPLVMLTGCDYIDKLLGKKKSKSESSEVTKDQPIKTIPDDAYIKGYSGWIKVPKGDVSPMLEHKLKRQAINDAKKKVRTKFNRKHNYPRCLPNALSPHPIIIGDFSSHSKSTWERKSNRIRMVHHLAWTVVRCYARGKIAGRVTTTWLMLENEKMPRRLIETQLRYNPPPPRGDKFRFRRRR